MIAEDDGIGFDKVSDKDLHTIRERIALLGVRVRDQSSSQANPHRNMDPLSRKEIRCAY